MWRVFRLVGIGAAVALAALAAMVLLPHDRYVRWQAMKVEAFARLGWIYERIHFDPTPIDIAFIGTSHTLNGVDAEAFERHLAAAGMRGRDGACLHAVNLAIPSYGRNLHWILARELLSHRRIRTLVIEIFENETRKAHPLFISVADVGDVLSAPALINLNYLHDLARLPFRQLSLWAKSQSPRSWGLKETMDFTDYDGSNVDNTRVVNVGGIALTPVRDHVMDPARLDAEASALMTEKNLHMLGGRFHDMEYAVPTYYLGRILELAREKGVEVVFLYLPGYGKPARPADDRLYRGAGATIFPDEVLARREYWTDVNHLNLHGAAHLTRLLAERWAGLGLSGTAAFPAGPACAPGYSPRPLLKAATN